MAEGKEQMPVLAGAIEEGVLKLTLNRPERMNAIIPSMLAALEGHFRQADEDGEVRVIVLKGAGRVFCSGQDMVDRDPRSHAWPFDLEQIQLTQFQPVIRAMTQCRKPIVVAVNGVASGAGAAIALGGDIVVAAESAKFAFSFVRVGLSVDAACGWHLVRALGSARARGLLLTGGVLSARGAQDIGLIWQCVADEQLDRSSTELARRLADGPGIAHGLIKRAVAAAQSVSFDDYLIEEAGLQGIAGRTEDYREGVLSFLEKRPAKFLGR